MTPSEAQQWKDLAAMLLPVLVIICIVGVAAFRSGSRR